MSSKLSKCLVTGGAGFIGSHIATELVSLGCEVTILDNLCAGHKENFAHIQDKVTFVEADVRDQDAVAEAMRGVDTVFHQAALASVPLSMKEPLTTHEACVTGTVNVLDAARKEGVRRVVYAGSSSAYGDSPEMLKREDHLPRVETPYAAAKLAGEYYCQSFAAAYDLEVVRLRYFNVFGPRQDPKSPYSAVIPLFASALIEGRRPKIFGSGEQSRDFVYVGNVVHANILAATVPGVSGNVYNVASGMSISVLDLLHKICLELNLPFDPEFMPARDGDILHSWAEISRIKDDLGYTVRTNFDEGLKATLEFYKASVTEHSVC